MTSSNPPDSDTSDREVVLSRLLDAPRELVFQVWIDPNHVAKWWGPNGFKTTIHEMNVHPGGMWRFIMHGPDGVDYPNRIKFVEIVKPERLVYDHYGDVGDPLHFHVTVTFDDQGGKTLLTMRSLFDSAAELKRVVDEHGAIEGGIQHLARLAEYLATV